MVGHDVGSSAGSIGYPSPQGVYRVMSYFPSPPEVCVVIAIRGERPTVCKDLERGSLRLWKIVACVKPNVLICLGRQNPNVLRLPLQIFSTRPRLPFPVSWCFHIVTQPLEERDGAEGRNIRRNDVNSK